MNPPANFDRLARIYRWMEWVSFGPWLGLCRFAFLTEVIACRNAIVLGDGDGRFTARLLAANPAIRIDAVDASSAMLNALCRRAGPNSSRLSIHLADARQWQPAAPSEILPDENAAYDLIVTHFFLDCLTTAEVQSLAASLRRAVSPNAVWMVSEFAVPPGLFGRIVARPLVSALYAAFALLTGLTVRSLPNHAAALRRAGFTLQQRRKSLGGLLVSELWSVSETQLV
jgi:ubiquinone/menaquinone biosynthesis C-methylase UbiE